MNAREHARLLGIFLLVQTGLQAFGGIIGAVIYGGLGAFMVNAPRDEDRVMGIFFVVAAVVVAVVVLAFAAVTLIAGLKLLKDKPGGRGWGIAASCLSLLSFPLGTALGVYGLWFLFGDKGRFYEPGAGNMNPVNNYPPPPPNHWQ